MKLGNKLKTTTFSFALILLMITSSAMTLQIAPVKAASYPSQPSGSISLPSGVTPDMSLQPTLGLSFRPNPVGVGQTVLVNV